MSGIKNVLDVLVFVFTPWLNLVNTIIDDREFWRVKGRFESGSTVLGEETGWPMLTQLHPVMQTVD